MNKLPPVKSRYKIKDFGYVYSRDMEMPELEALAIQHADVIDLIIEQNMQVVLSVDDTDKEILKNQKHPKPVEMRCRLGDDTLIIYANLLTADEYQEFHRDIYVKPEFSDDAIKGAELILATYAYEVITPEGKEADKDTIMTLAGVLGQYAMAYVGLVINKFYSPMTADKGRVNYPLHFINASSNAPDELGGLLRVMFEGNCDDAAEKSHEEIMKFINTYSHFNKTHDGYKDTPHLAINSILKAAKQLEEE